jgi:hypothetical protein
MPELVAQAGDLPGHPDMVGQSAAAERIARSGQRAGGPQKWWAWPIATSAGIA